MERLVTFWGKYLIPFRSVPWGASRDAPRDALSMAGTLFFPEKSRKSRKFAEIRGVFRDFCGKSRVYMAFHGKKSEKVAFFHEKCGASPEK